MASWGLFKISPDCETPISTDQCLAKNNACWLWITSNFKWCLDNKGTWQSSRSPPASATVRARRGLPCSGWGLEAFSGFSTLCSSHNILSFLAYKADICWMGTIFQMMWLTRRTTNPLRSLANFVLALISVSVSCHLQAQWEFGWWRDIYVKKKLIKIKLYSPPELYE